MTCDSGACIHFKIRGDLVSLWGDKYPDGQVDVSREEWDAFVAAVKAGEFDNVEES